jgi:ABC-type multidrug transport system fused ATPase/permease subunit
MISLFGSKADVYNFVITSTFLLLSGYFQQSATIISGYMLTSFTDSNYKLSSIDAYIQYAVCNFTDCATVTTDKVSWVSFLLICYLLTKFCTVLFDQLNIWVHHNACERRNTALKVKTYEHVLNLDQE